MGKVWIWDIIKWLILKKKSILPNIVIILICPGEEIPRFQLCNKKEEE